MQFTPLLIFLHQGHEEGLGAIETRVGWGTEEQGRVIR